MHISGSFGMPEHTNHLSCKCAVCTFFQPLNIKVKENPVKPNTIKPNLEVVSIRATCPNCGGHEVVAGGREALRQRGWSSVPNSEGVLKGKLLCSACVKTLTFPMPTREVAFKAVDETLRKIYGPHYRSESLVMQGTTLLGDFVTTAKPIGTKIQITFNTSR